MVFNNYIEFLIQHVLTNEFYINFFLLLLFCFFIFIFFICIFDIINFFKNKRNEKKILLTKERNLKNLRKKYLDGKINAKEYKIKTNNILNS